MNAQTNTDAGIGPAASITAGGGGSIAVEANYIEHVDALAFAGGAGAVAVFAQVAVVNAASTQKAHVDGGAQVRRAGAGLAVTSTANRTVSTLGIGGGVGLGAIGASVTIVSASGNTEATVGAVAFGADGPVGGVTVTADDPLTATAYAINVAAGLGAGLGAAVAVVERLAAPRSPPSAAPGRSRAASPSGRSATTPPTQTPSRSRAARSPPA